MRTLLALAIVACAHPVAPAPCGAALQQSIADEIRIIDNGDRIETTIDEHARSPDQQRAVTAAGALLDSRARIVDAHDVAILDRALALLVSEATWNRADDRSCPPGAPTVSLFCALQRASIEVLGVYQHRRAALQEVRFAIDEATRGRSYAHRLRDYNNDPTTTLGDLRAVIAVARTRVVARLPRCDQ